MKKGKTSQLNLFKDAKCYYGTVDSVNLKTIYVVLQTWVEPIKEFDNWDRSTGLLERYIKHSLLEVVDNNYFEKHNIVDLDLRSSGIKKGKRSFMNLEITLYLKNQMDFKSMIIRNSVKNIISSVYQDNIKGSGFFKIHLNKSVKEKNLIEV